MLLMEWMSVDYTITNVNTSPGLDLLSNINLLIPVQKIIIKDFHAPPSFIVKASSKNHP